MMMMGNMLHGLSDAGDFLLAAGESAQMRVSPTSTCYISICISCINKLCYNVVKEPLDKRGIFLHFTMKYFF